jgi:RimJ/RimL family protein N-acetyltransferase
MDQIRHSKYKCLKNQEFKLDNYKIVPLRFQDKYQIMSWRNEQMFHLRQNTLLTKENQDKYFIEIISKIYDEINPNQILFSYLENDICIGYGGLVHINWENKNAEISFVLNTKLENFFIEHWCTFLSLIENVAFNEIKLYKIFTYAFDLRPKLYIALEKSNFKKEATLVNHTIVNEKLVDVVIHSKFKNNNYTLREANTYHDALILFKWVNNITVRQNSLNSESITIQNHIDWFENKMKDENCKIYILTDLFNSNIGQIRVEMKDEYFEIDYTISEEYRGKGFGNKIIKLLQVKLGNVNLLAKVKNTNIPSIKIFTKNGFKLVSEYDDILIFTKNYINV